MSILIQILFFIFLCFLDVFGASNRSKGSFTIDYEHDTFLLNGKPFRYLAGSIHYPRIHHTQWQDRILKAKAAGLDAISTYVMWNVHEAEKGVFDFEGQNNLTHFLELCHKHDLYVILRAGPYVCAEWEFGGFPAWLMASNMTINLRTMDPNFIKAVDGWMGKLLPMMKPYLIQNGGPIISVQIENEYGSYDSCDHRYMDHLALIFKKWLGDEVVLFTTDGNSDGYLKCGTTKLAYATVDFGVTNDVEKAFEAMRKFNKKGPLVNSELYTGWLDNWGERHNKNRPEDVVGTIENALKLNASVNMYMFEGGTNFGFMNGVDPGNKIQITSYDYDSPLSEAGDVTPKYLALRKMMLKYKPHLSPIPPNSTKEAYGFVELKSIGSLISLLPVLSSGVHFDSISPLNMEQIGHYYGFVLYRHILKRNFASSLLQLTSFADRAHVLLDKRLLGILDSNMVDSLLMQGYKGQKLDIIVENTGRVNYGKEMRNGKKGIMGNVLLGGKNLTNWRLFPLFVEKDGIKRRQNENKWWVDLVEQIEKLGIKKEINIDAKRQSLYSPHVFIGYLNIETTPQDTFLSMCGWSRGVVWINGVNLGRYRPKEGPQTAFYLPKPFLKSGLNRVLVLEMDGVSIEKSHVEYKRDLYGELMKMDNLNFIEETFLGGYKDELDVGSRTGLSPAVEVFGGYNDSVEDEDSKTGTKLLWKTNKKIVKLGLKDEINPTVKFVDKSQIDSSCF